jgi:glycosyltransferase involved in cell wall biosynthesis
VFSKKWPLPILNYTSGAMMAALDTIMGEQEFDLIHLDSIHMAAYVPILSRAKHVPVIYDWHNIESEAMRRYSKHSPSVLRARYAAMTAGRLESLEDRILQESYGHLVCSQREREELMRRVPSARIAVIENGVDSGIFAETAAAAGERIRIVFVGWMAYHANAEAAIFFARDIWPGISRQFPQWTLTLVGLDPTPAVRALHGSGNIEVTGTVPDVRPYYAEAVAAIVPLRVGGGTRLKILEAMAAGVPVISTTLGAEGLAVLPGRDLLIADRDEDWLAHLQTLVQNSGIRRELVAAGRALVCDRYDWQVLGQTLYETYAGWLKNPL